jgi:hypothetical protein
VTTRVTIIIRVAASAALVLAACCPDPSSGGADASGSTGGDGSSGSGAARFGAIQRDLFDRHCVTDCHESLGAAADLSLTSARSYQDLVNHASQQIASQRRVVPGDADSSYLIKKLEAAPGIVGDQMPRLAPPRPQAEIDHVRAWITRGAPDD